MPESHRIPDNNTVTTDSLSTLFCSSLPPSSRPPHPCVYLMEDSGRGMAVGPSNPTPNSKSLSPLPEGGDKESRNLFSKLAAAANFYPFSLTLLQRVAACLRGQETAMTS